jgi:hypothetical protein
MEEQSIPLSHVERAKRAFYQDKKEENFFSRTSTSTYHHTIQGKTWKQDDCQFIISNVLENTVFNILAELSLESELEKELSFVPKKNLFPL